MRSRETDGVPENWKLRIQRLEGGRNQERGKKEEPRVETSRSRIRRKKVELPAEGQQQA